MSRVVGVLLSLRPPLPPSSELLAEESQLVLGGAPHLPFRLFLHQPFATLRIPRKSPLFDPTVLLVLPQNVFFLSLELCLHLVRVLVRVHHNHLEGRMVKSAEIALTKYLRHMSLIVAMHKPLFMKVVQALEILQ